MLSLLTMRAEVYSAQLASNETAAKGGVYVAADRCDFRFSNRPFWVKHFQTIHRCSINVARGLALLLGLGTRALP
jgi:hypothetical protein